MPIIPIAVVALASYGGYRLHRGSKHGMTPERKKLFEEALKGKLPAKDLRELADGFEKAGLEKEAKLLRQRAMLKELPKEQRQERNKVFRDAMASNDHEGILELAHAYESQGATGAAARLKERASALKAGQG